MNPYFTPLNNWASLGDPDRRRHWSPDSQPHAGGDQLLAYLQDGWLIDKITQTETHWFGEARYTVVYRFILTRGAQQTVMPVISNPFVRRLVREPEHRLALSTLEMRAAIAEIATQR